MKRLKTKKGIAFLVTLVVVGASAFGAYAYFTSSGSGAGTAATGTSTALNIVQTSAVTGLTPDGGAMAVPFKIFDPTADGAQNLGVVSITGLSVDAPYSTNGCLASWYSVTPAANPVGTIAAGTFFTSDPTTEPTIQMNSTADNQDACKNATLSFTLSAAQGT